LNCQPSRYRLPHQLGGQIFLLAEHSFYQLSGHPYLLAELVQTFT
jgi:hypothetical protein